MAQVGFTRDRIKENDRVPTFNPQSNGEMIRGAILESPQRRFVHNLTKPQLDRRGRIKQEERDGSRGKYMVDLTDFVARTICLGDEGTVEDNGIDPKNCPACRVSSEHPEWVKPPEERYALNFLIYKTKPGSYNLSSPYSVEVLPWAFTQKTFNDLVKKLIEEFGDDHIKDHDVQIKVKNYKFRLYDISMSHKSEWQADATRKAHTEEALASQRVDDSKLESAIARSMKASEIQVKLDEIEKVWRQVRSGDDDEDEDDAVDRASTRKAELGNGLTSLKGADEDEDEAPRSSGRAPRVADEDDEDERPARSRRTSKVTEVGDTDEDEAPAAKPAKSDDDVVAFEDLFAGMSKS